MRCVERSSDRGTARGPFTLACAISLALGLFFIFVWAPHPWGWGGFDHYHEIAIDLARGRPFPTMEVPWAYAYFLAAFYRAFGVHPWIPLIVQAALNALTPLLVFAVADAWVNRRTAVVAALLTGALSFNTVYASTESSDALCTVIFMAAIFMFVRGLQRRRVAWFCAAGLLAGAAPQFRPNLILLPFLLAGFGLVVDRTRRRVAEAGALVACAAAILMPWVVRNYRLTGTVLPTSIHGGVQLWYGTLQVGPYLHSRAYNPRSIFDAPAFDYTSLDNVPIVVEAEFDCTEPRLADVKLVYRTDANPVQQHAAPARDGERRYVFQIPPPGRDAVVYYYFVATWSEPSGPIVRTTPAGGSRDPFVYFVSHNHMGDLDVHGDLLDVFDVVRLVRHAAWAEPVPSGDELEATGVKDVKAAVAVLMRPTLGDGADTAVFGVESDAVQARLTFSDGSRIVVPRQWHGRITDLAVGEGIASGLVTSTRSIKGLGTPARRLSEVERCEQSVTVGVNQVFYRREPQMMRRYAALALDNIRLDPLGFLIASAYRGVRMFIIEGDSDPFTAHQFTGSARIYAIATAASAGLLILCVAGIAIGWRRGYRIGLPLLLIAYVPATAGARPDQHALHGHHPAAHVHFRGDRRHLRKSEVRSQKSEVRRTESGQISSKLRLAFTPYF